MMTEQNHHGGRYQFIKMEYCLMNRLLNIHLGGLYLNYGFWQQ